METAKCHESGQSHAMADALEKLAKEATRERQAIGYPERCGKISYSQTVRHLAAKALLHGFSPSIVASAAAVQIQTVQKWAKRKEQAPFRELRIVPAHEPEPGRREVEGKEKRRDQFGRSMEFLLPSGIRILVDREDFDEDLLGIFIRAKGE